MASMVGIVPSTAGGQGLLAFLYDFMKTVRETQNRGNNGIDGRHRTFNRWRLEASLLFYAISNFSFLVSIAFSCADNV